ncbi:bifunctional diaminohydroxyphosphoribosylaminopyrimidine deaminase/5-amino-6-(5-phosphoribosylamino)uracil reductase RibD [Gammaproteobacteria bacterium]|nr:bifunctional diaminohydroxyphosphoribosylaminopyrimidine deaminase/5-amino-6-(5-phosphoribosylamino)uracil reductase RibD [Gammaproteobacteria bacterium]
MIDADITYMQRCLELARMGRYSARPNPAVGSLIVSNETVIAEGWHEKAGQDHAEIMALKNAGADARGGTVYVTLEPCSFIGKTGPCCDALIAAGIQRLVYGMVDPNPKVAGSGLEKIRAAGIAVDGPVLEKECSALNPGFIKRMTHGLPYVRCKLAMSLDGRTAMASGESKWITGAAAREDVQRYRAVSGAILTGIETIIADDPGLDVRNETLRCEQPLRVIVDSQLRISPQAKTLHRPGKVLLVTAISNDDLISEKHQAMANNNVSILSCANAKGRVDLEKLLRILASEYQCNDLLLESGAELAGAMLTAGLVDEVLTYIAPKLLGSDARPLFSLPAMTTMSDQVEMEFLDVVMLGKDCRMRSRVIKTKLNP